MIKDILIMFMIEPIVINLSIEFHYNYTNFYWGVVSMTVILKS